MFYSEKRVIFYVKTAKTEELGYYPELITRKLTDNFLKTEEMLSRQEYWEFLPPDDNFTIEHLEVDNQFTDVKLIGMRNISNTGNVVFNCLLTVGELKFLYPIELDNLWINLRDTSIVNGVLEGEFSILENTYGKRLLVNKDNPSFKEAKRLDDNVIVKRDELELFKVYNIRKKDMFKYLFLGTVFVPKIKAKSETDITYTKIKRPLFLRFCPQDFTVGENPSYVKSANPDKYNIEDFISHNLNISNYINSAHYKKFTPLIFLDNSSFIYNSLDDIDLPEFEQLSASDIESMIENLRRAVISDLDNHDFQLHVQLHPSTNLSNLQTLKSKMQVISEDFQFRLSSMSFNRDYCEIHPRILDNLQFLKSY